MMLQVKNKTEGSEEHLHRGSAFMPKFLVRKKSGRRRMKKHVGSVIYMKVSISSPYSDL